MRHTLAILALAATAQAGELARFEIVEPLGQNWNGDWLTEPVQVPVSDKLRLLGPDGQAVPAQFTASNVLFQANLKANATNTFTVVDDAGPVSWAPLRHETGKVANGLWELNFDAQQPLPVSSTWPAGVEVTRGEG